MRKKIFLISFLILASFVFSRCEHIFEPEKRVMRELTPLEKRLVQSSEGFGLKLFREVVKTEAGKNVFISPLSVSMALGMTLNGADSTTKQAMQETLGFTGMTTEEINRSYKSLIELLTQLDPGVQFRIANSIWYQQDMAFEQEFIDLNKTFFNAVVRALDFGNAGAAANLINAWVNENTNGKIEKIIESGDIDLNTVMFLINAIYFKGVWTYQFDAKKTKDDWFHLADGSRIRIPMMQMEADLSYFANELFQAVDLPYGDAGFSMTIFLPNPQTDIDTMIAQMNRQNWQQWMASFSKQTLDLLMPKFTLEYKLSLNAVLKSLGMGIAFDPLRADFTRMYRPGGLYIDEVKHKTFVEVNEEGTEAAAVTSVEMMATSLPPQFRMDRPFVFAIRENQSGTILFIGKMTNPGG